MLFSKNIEQISALLTLMSMEYKGDTNGKN